MQEIEPCPELCPEPYSCFLLRKSWGLVLDKVLDKVFIYFAKPCIK